jgi:DNA-binding transcriptional LysR family regulator
MDLNALLVFARVVAAGSFSEGARRLNMPLSTVSRRIADLEAQLGVRLLERSTRNLRLTEIGHEVLEQARLCIGVNETVTTMVSDKLSDVSGQLRLSAPPSISDTLVAPLISAFQKAHPNVSVQVFVTDRMIDHVGENVDLTFRLGPLKDSSLVAVKVLTYRHQLVASPDYLAQRPPPLLPQDLLQHRLFAFSHWQPVNSWSFVKTGVNTGGKASGKAIERVMFQPYVSMNDYAGLTSALLKGGGIGDLPPVVQPELIRSGRLVEVMPDWRFRTFDLSLVHLGNRHIARQVRAFKELAIRLTPGLFPDLPT